MPSRAEGPPGGGLKVEYDLEWLTILRTTAALRPVMRSRVAMPMPGEQRRYVATGGQGTLHRRTGEAGSPSHPTRVSHGRSDFRPTEDELAETGKQFAVSFTRKRAEAEGEVQGGGAFFRGGTPVTRNALPLRTWPSQTTLHKRCGHFRTTTVRCGRAGVPQTELGSVH